MAEDAGVDGAAGADPRLPLPPSLALPPFDRWRDVTPHVCLLRFAAAAKAVAAGAFAIGAAASVADAVDVGEDGGVVLGICFGCDCYCLCC